MSPRKGNNNIGSVRSNAGLYHIVQTDGSDGNFDIKIKEEEIDDKELKNKQKNLFGIPANEMRISMNDETPFKIME